MNVEEFLSTMDALRFDTDLDETYPELRGMVRKVYPYIRKIYNMMNEAGILTESVNEEHGNKKHKSPKNALNAVRKGNRDAEREIYGDGFRPGKKIHKAKTDYSRKSNKVDINNLEKYNESTIKLSENDLKQIVLESYKRLMGKFINEETIGVDYSDKDDFGKYAPGLSVNWGNNIESLISKLEEKFSEVITPEEDEYGISSTPLENLINHLKYYYEHETFDSACFNSIYKMLDNYDFTSDEEVLNILKQLKKYC